MSAPLRRLAVVGLGLLGGSVALAARARGMAREITGSGRSPESQEAARRSGAFDRVAPLEEAVAGADLVVLATPVSAMSGVLRRAAPALATDAVVTDVGSVKAPLTDVLPGLLPPGRHFVGAHPMAGGHETGIVHARPDLFEGACVVVTPTPGSDAVACQRVRSFWSGLGGRLLERTPDAHDAAVAWVSHLPHLVAFAYGAALAQAPEGTLALAGPGFRDFTRIARSDAELWAEILAWNAKALAGPLHAVAQELATLGRALETGDADVVLARLSAAAEGLRPEGFQARSGGENPEIRVSEGDTPRSRSKTS